MWNTAPVNQRTNVTRKAEPAGAPVWVPDPRSGGEGGGGGSWTTPWVPDPASGGEGGGTGSGQVQPPSNSQGGEGGAGAPAPAPVASPAPGPSAADAEAARQKALIDKINEMYKGRDGIYSGVYKNAYDLQKARLDEQRLAVLRKMRFNSARSGLAGGSAQITQNALENRTFGRALSDSSNAAQQQADQVRAADDRQRLNLISQIRNGALEADATDAALVGMRDTIAEGQNWQNYDAVNAYLSTVAPLAQDWQRQQSINDALVQYGNRYGRVPSAYYGRIE